MPIQKSQLNLPTGHGDDSVTFKQYITGLEGSHLASRVTGESLTIN